MRSIRIFAEETLPVINTNNKILGLFSTDFKIKQKIPYFTLLIIYILILCHIACGYYYEFNLITGHFEGRHLYHNPLILVYTSQVVRQYYIWQFITYAFFHLNLMHLVSNIILFTGPCLFLEVLYTWKPICVLVFLSIIFSSIIQCTFYSLYPYDEVSDIALLGISGAIYALYGLFFCHYIALKNHIISKLNLILIILIICSDYVYSDNNQALIAVEAHLAGYIYGLYMSVFLIHDYLRQIYRSILYSLCIIINIISLTVSPLILFL
jgi:membrane associated rhomboid family serine protease